MVGDGYDSDRRGFDSNERGRIFENGADRFFRDRENGYTVHSRTYEAGKYRIQFDKIKVDRDRIFTIEEKSGMIRADKDLKQLRAVRQLLRENDKHQHILRSVAGESISKEAQELIVRLIQDFPDQFTHQIIARSDAREIWARGLAMERGKEQQLELPGVREKARQGKAQELQKQKDKIAERARARDRAEKFCSMLRFREAAARGRVDAPQKIERDRQAREEAERFRSARGVDGRVRVEQAAAERVALEFPVPDQYPQREAAGAGEQSARDGAEVASVERAAAEARAAAEKEREAAFKAREAAEKERAEERARLQARGIPPEVVQLLQIGQAEPPSAAVREPPGTSPRVQRGHWHSQDRSRAIERGR
ncbi:hypothetical protein [Nocardia beijingensis]|uniref:hypothetical protein n=1 Tax=Nocardia beijingensis TaxID=95162 RepID=UPI0033B1084D